MRRCSDSRCNRRWLLKEHDPPGKPEHARAFGFYEALDYTKARLPAGQAHATVQSYMAHHQGMILLAACNYLLEDVMVQRFHADERIQSVELLLQEKIPQNPPIEYPHSMNRRICLPGRIMLIAYRGGCRWKVPARRRMYFRRATPAC